MELKALMDRRNELVGVMEQLSGKATNEVRAFTDEERAQYDTADAERRNLEETIKRIKEQRDSEVEAPADEPQQSDIPDEEYRAFGDYIRGNVSTRADNLTFTDNGAVIPSSIANKIIEKITDICPIYQLANKYNIGGNLSIPYYDEESQAITMTYADEFTELESSSGKFASIELKGFLAGVLSKISLSLVNNSKFDIVGYVIEKVAQAAARWIERELLLGSASKIDGISKAKQVITAAASDKITTDELIDLQESIPDAYQQGAVWIMSKATRTAIRKFKDNDGNYILNKDMTSRWGYTLFGRDVYVSSQMSDITADKPAVIYGDMSGLAVKISEEFKMQVLREKYATEHAVGVVGWMELDSKIENEQKIAVLKMAGE